MPAKFDRCVARVSQDSSVDNPHAVCVAALGEAFESDGELTADEEAAIDAAVARHKTEAASSGAAGATLRASQTWSRPTLKLSETVRPRRIRRESAGGSVSAVGLQAGAREVPVVIIREGPGNLHDRHYYTRQCIETAPAVFEGVKAFINHPSASEELEQPERRVEDIIGSYRSVRAVEGTDGRMELRAILRILDADTEQVKAARGVLAEAADYAKQYSEGVFAGISINADGEDSPAEINGEPWNAVTKFTSAMSADVVTFPAAGGRVLGLLESVRDASVFGRKREAGAMKKLISGLKKSAEALTTAKSAEERTAAATELKAGLMAAELMYPDGDGEKPAAPSGTAPAPHPEATEADEEGRKKAAEAEEESATEATESMRREAGLLRESAVAVKASNPSLAAKLEAAAGSLDRKVVDFGKQRTKIRTLEGQLAYTESVQRAHRLLVEAKVSTGADGVIEPRSLYGKPEAEQRALIETARKIEARIEARIAQATGHVEGGEARMPATMPGTAASLKAEMREAQIPVR